MDVIQPLAAVVLVLALLCGALFVLKRRGAAAFGLPRLTSGGQRRMEVLERLALGPHHVLHLVRVGDRSIVVHFLRQALGTQSAPSNQVLAGLALFLTMVLIEPTATQIYREAWQPME